MELMVIDVETLSSGMPSNSRSMSASEEIATPDAADFARGQRMVGIEAHLRRQVEGDRKSGGALREQVAVAPVALFGGAEAGVLAHGPEPAAVHVAVDAARVGELARPAQFMAHEREILRARRKEEIAVKRS